MSNHVIFGISGSISAYKSVDIIRLLRKSDIGITPVFSESAHKFVTQWTVETLAESPLIKNDVINGQISHLDVCKNAQSFIICPASANCIAKLAAGLADDILTASFLSYTGPKILFPAMHTEMYENPITQKNLETLRDSGTIIIPPTIGDLACGDTGTGRLPDVNLIADIIKFSLVKPINLSGQSIVITCGGTSEPIDSVRSITNSASGLSGHVLANMAAFFGAHVTLIRSNIHPTLDSIQTIEVSTAADLEAALIPFATTSDKLIMNAAVSDFSTLPRSSKLPRSEKTELQLTPTNDILKLFNSKKQAQCKSIGFCLHDSDDLVEIAKRKRIDKDCDLMIANDPSSFGQPYRTIHIIDHEDVTSHINISLYSLAHELLKL